MGISITGGRLELGRVLAQRSQDPGRGPVHFDLSGQQANTLLHDGHAWKDFPRLALSGTRRAIREAGNRGAGLLVHASFAFVHAVENGAAPGPPLRSCVDAILECEALVLAGPVPACVVRLGYLYGPESADLRAYRKAFRLGRPYWPGPASAKQYHLHLHDAAAALLAAAGAGKAGGIRYATDGRAASFMQFMDAFAHRVGRSRPLHLPPLSRRLARLIIAEEHMQQTALSMPPGPPSPRVPRWRAKFPDFRKGLDQVIDDWQGDPGARGA